MITTPAGVSEDKVTVPLAVKSVKLPVEGVSVPIAVLFIPEAVVLKLAEVTVRSLAPVFILEAPRPERDRDPEVAVRSITPLAVKSVKTAVEGVVAPMAVELMPAAVVLKLAEVINRSLAPVEILD